MSLGAAINMYSFYILCWFQKYGGNFHSVFLPTSEILSKVLTPCLSLPLSLKLSLSWDPKKISKETLT